MSFLDKIINNEEKLVKWDSRVLCKQEILNSMFTEDVQGFINKQDSYSIYYNCFLNNMFNTEIGTCFLKKKTFIKCEFEVVNLIQAASFFKFNEFEKCTFYTSNPSNINTVFQLCPELKDIFENSCNTVIYEPYITYLSNKYSHNLNKIPEHLLAGISLDYADLSNYILPKDNNFFKNLSSKTINYCKFDNVDFRNYKLLTTTFTNCVFNSKCILSKEMMSLNLYKCALPVINFNNYTIDNSTNLSFNGCSFQNGTIFPKDKDFFLRCSVREAILPVYDYSDYNVTSGKYSNIFSGCTFKEGSKLPKDLFKSENISILKKIKEVPAEYLDCYIRYNLIKDPYKFLESHHHKLSDTSFMILCKKYNLVL